MSGLFCDFSTERVVFVATDAHKLVRHIRTDVNSDINTSFILPKKPLNIIKNNVSENDEILVQYNETNALFSLKLCDINIKGPPLTCICM